MRTKIQGREREGHITHMHIQCINTEIVGGEIQRLEHLRQRQMLAITEDDRIL